MEELKKLGLLRLTLLLTAAVFGIVAVGILLSMVIMSLAIGALLVSFSPFLLGRAVKMVRPFFSKQSKKQSK